MNRLKKILGTRLAGIICFLFAIANRIIFTSLYSLIGTDTKIQLTYAQNLMAGKGMGVTKYFTHDVNTPIFDTHQWFPPGFSISIIPFLKLSGGDEFKAVFIFDILTAILFVIAVRSVGKKAGLPAHLNNIVTLIAGCTQYIFFMDWASTDIISLCFLLFAFAETIGIISKKENISLWRTLTCGFLFCLPFFFRYMYLPIAVLLPLLILLFGIFSKNKELQAGSKLLVSSISFLALLFLFNLMTAGNAIYIHNVGRGFFINQLVDFYPFLPASFINLDFAAQLIERFSGLEYSSVMFYFKIINVVLLIFLLISLLRYIGLHKKKLLVTNHFIFIITGSAISITIILLLTYLSLTYKELTWGLNTWTHVQDARYFSFIYIFILVLFFTSLHHYASFFKRSFMRVFVFIALCVLGAEVLHGVYYNIKIISQHKDLAVIREADNGYRNFSAIIAKIKKENPGQQLLVSSPDQYYLHAASQLGYKAIFDYENLWQAELRVTSKSLLIMPVHTEEAAIMKTYIEKKKPRLLLTVAGTNFYIEEIVPQ
jgi:hypothetical protein